MSELFQLQNDPPRPRRLQLESNSGRQRMLLAGLDCLAGQLDLFATDGEADGLNESATAAQKGLR